MKLIFFEISVSFEGLIFSSKPRFLKKISQKLPRSSEKTRSSKLLMSTHGKHCEEMGRIDDEIGWSSGLISSLDVLRGQFCIPANLSFFLILSFYL